MNAAIGELDQLPVYMYDLNEDARAWIEFGPSLRKSLEEKIAECQQCDGLGEWDPRKPEYRTQGTLMIGCTRCHTDRVLLVHLPEVDDD